MADTTNKLRVVFGDVTLGLGGDGFHYIFSYATGGPESLVAGGREWLYRTPKPTFWRALTDNDRGCQFHLTSGIWLAADMFIRVTGAEVAVDGKPIPLPMATENNRYTGNETAERVAITFHYQTVTVPAAAVDVTYDVTADGRIRVTCAYHGVKGLPELPVFGLRFVMPTKAVGFTYEGLSGETYPDRMAGGVPGVYKVKGLPVTPYVVPQECGMHMQTKWVRVRRDSALSNVRDEGLESSLTFSAADAPFAFSCLPYTAEELENATHHEELPPERRTVLCVYGAVRGVGGINSWGADVQPPYHISGEGEIAFSFDVKPE